MALDLQRVERIHTRLMVRYGAKWLNLWAGVPTEAVKVDWAEQLGGMSDSAILHALDNLPTELPPNVAQFRALALRRPEAMAPALPAPPADPARVSGAMAAAQKVRADADPKAWARRLKAAEGRGERMTPAQRAMWRSALAGAAA